MNVEERAGAAAMADVSARKTAAADAVAASGRETKIRIRKKNHNLNNFLAFPERILDISLFPRPDFLILRSSSSWSE